VARSLVVTLVLQAVLRELLDEGRAVPRCHYDIVVATGLASGTVHPVLTRLTEAGWVTSQEVPPPPGRWRRPKRDYLLTGEGLSLAVRAIAARPAARRENGEVARRALRVLERTAEPVTTRQIMVAAGDGDSAVLAYYQNLTAHFTAGRVTRYGSRGPYTWLITAAGRDWLARGGGLAPTRDENEKRGASYRSKDKQEQRNKRFRESAGRLYRPWTDAERETAARDDLTVAEIAVLLGRTPQSVASIRTHLGKGENEADYRSARENRKRQQNEATRETASHHRQPWTGTDLEIASRDDLTLEQMAATLGRTISAVHAMRTRLNSSGDPRARDLRDGTPPTSMS
jgi:PadR family transcriptional regulator, regulatory protein PadR